MSSGDAQILELSDNFSWPRANLDLLQESLVLPLQTYILSYWRKLVGKVCFQPLPPLFINMNLLIFSGSNSAFHSLIQAAAPRLEATSDTTGVSFHRDPPGLTAEVQNTVSPASAALYPCCIFYYCPEVSGPLTLCPAKI